MVTTVRKAGRKPQAAFLPVAADKVFEAGLENMDTPAVEQGHDFRVDVHTADVIAHFGETRRAHKTDVAGADNAYAHRCSLAKQYGRDAGRGGGATGFGNGVPSFFPRVTIRRHSVNLTSAPADGNLLPEGAHMAIIGIGLDLIELSRMERSLHRFGEHFLNRIMADDERSAIPGDPASPSARAVSHVAARFAAKEAAVKALGTGFAEGIGPRDVAVRSLPSGKPELVLSGKAREKADALGVKKLHLTLTHTRDNAAAVVILEG